MKHSAGLLILVLAVFPLAGFASSNCESLIKKMEKQTTEFMNLNYASEKDQKAARQLQSEIPAPTDGAIEGFNTVCKAGADRLKAWKALVNLAQAQAPFDFESAAADVISRQLRKEKRLEASYLDAVKNFPDHCRSALLSGMVKEDQCVAIHGDSDASVNKCAAQDKKDKDYESCIGMKHGQNGSAVGPVAHCDSLHKSGTADLSDILKTLTGSSGSGSSNAQNSYDGATDGSTASSIAAHPTNPSAGPARTPANAPVESPYDDSYDSDRGPASVQ